MNHSNTHLSPPHSGYPPKCREVSASTVAELPRHPDEPDWAEANVQAEFYHQARLAGLPVLLELSTPVGRIDIAVLCADRSGIVAVVECKRQGRTVYGSSRQIARYKRLGVPVYGLCDWNRAQRLVQTIKERHAGSKGVSWVQVDHTIALPRRGTWKQMDPLPTPGTRFHIEC